MPFPERPGDPAPPAVQSAVLGDMDADRRRVAAWVLRIASGQPSSTLERQRIEESIRRLGGDPEWFTDVEGPSGDTLMPRIRHRGPHGGGVHIRMDRCLTNQVLDDFVNGNFQALQARRDLGTPQDYRTMNNRRLAVQVYIETIEASDELRDLALNALQRAAMRAYFSSPVIR